MTEQEKLINVDLYGDGSRDSRLRAEYIYCDHADVCSVYKEGKCFRKTTLFGVRCEFGRIACVDGGTKKTKMYGRVYSEAKDSERYHKLSYPNNTYIAKIGDGAFLAPPYVRIERGPDSRLFCHNPGFGCNRLFVSIDELTPDNINRICTYHRVLCLVERLRAIKQKPSRSFSTSCPNYSQSSIALSSRRSQIMS